MIIEFGAIKRSPILVSQYPKIKEGLRIIVKEDIYELWQNDKLFITGTKKDLAEFTGLSLGTIDNYCRPGYLEKTKNENNNRVVKVTDKVKMTEHEIQSNILLEVSKRGHKIWRSNAGKIKDARTGNWINLLPKGFPDTFGFRKSDGKFFAIEVKTKTGRLRKEQKQFAEFAEGQPILYGVARSKEEAIAIIEEEK